MGANVKFTVMERFLAGIQKTDSGCWNWIRLLDKHGYGVIRVGRKMRLVHRVAYELLTGPIPPGLVIDHICWNKVCCNPAHLRAITHVENARRQRSALVSMCIRGHEFSGENLYISPSGRRHCRACNRAAVARYSRKVAA